MVTSRTQCRPFSTPQCARATSPEALGAERCAEQVVCGLGGHFCADLADPDDLADGRQSRPCVPLLQPVDVGAHQAGPCLDAAMVAIDAAMGGVDRPLRVG